MDHVRFKRFLVAKVAPDSFEEGSVKVAESSEHSGAGGAGRAMK